MKQNVLRLLVVFAIGLTAACGDDDDSGGTPDTGGSDTSGSDTSGSGSGDTVASGDDHITVVIGGGADAGTYERDGAARCTVGFASEGAFGTQYSETALTEGLTSVQIIIPNFADGPASEFSASATIGPFLEGGTAYDLRGGTATVDDSGDTASVHIEGDADDGTAVTIDVDCASVLRNE